MARTRDKEKRKADAADVVAAAVEAVALDEADVVSDRKWHFAETLLTIVGILGGVALGAFVFYLATKGKQQGALGDAPAAAPNTLAMKVDKIKTLVRVATESTSPLARLTNASYARALLEDAETTFGAPALNTLCDVEKLKDVLTRIQQQHKRLPPG